MKSPGLSAGGGALPPLSKRFHSRCLMVAALLGGAILAPVASAGAATITVYVDADYRGASETFHDAEVDLRPIGWGDRISSIEVRSGIWELCRDSRFRNCKTVTRDQPNLKNLGFNDTVSSLRPVGDDDHHGVDDGENRSLTVYQDADFRGRKYTFYGPSPDLRAIGWNDDVSSVEVYGGPWELCRDKEFRHCQRVERDVDRLGDLGLNDEVSSLRPAADEVGAERSRSRSYSHEEAERAATRLYRGLLGRDPDAGGLRDATVQIQAGRLDQQVSSMVSSAEFRARIAETSAAEMLERIYLGLLDRLPDTDGTRTFLPQVESGRYADVALSLIGSEEFAQRIGG